MAPSFDGMASGLLCVEDSTSVFEDEGEWLGDLDAPGASSASPGGNAGGGCGGDDGLPMQSEECLALLLEKECQHSPRSDYRGRLRDGDINYVARKDAVDWIGKVHSYFSFGPLSAYLSINYLDRFLSAYELPMGKVWMTQLLAVACLSLAAKMEETEVPLSLDLQVGNAKYVFEARTIQRMELLVLSTLKWRLQSVTPFNFLDFFLRKINSDDVLPRLSMSRSIQLILSLSKGIDYLEFRPSEVAAAVAVSVARENQVGWDTEKALSLLARHVQREKVMKCMERLCEMEFIGGSGKNASSATASVPQSPIGVLDAATCLSYKSEEAGGGVVGNPPSSSSHDTTPDTNKRRRIG
ncbi:hypothetical protein MLD38_022409 [Melastoma candidum]|uniref:Uncharacterized protein n=1 Tax=Melastoma candidum TaxID=119954 RepID=A0ACB9QMJ1_9MYRT|nr:hypothetical protein MLD38_022409 [Melastoma candidum]